MNVPSRLLKSPVSGRNHQPGPRAHNDHDNEANTPTYPLPDRRSPIVSRTVPAADEPITFASFLPDVTKAVVNNEEDMEDFAVWMYIDGAPSLEQERVYNADAVSSSPLWTYDSKRFWTEGNYNFYALHPYPADGSGVTAGVTADGITSITLDSPNADIDLMTATATRDYPGDGDGAVAFTFDHLLSRVSIQAEAGAGNVQITSLTFSGMYDGGNYNPATASWDFTGRAADGSISLPEGSGPIDISPESSVLLLSDLLLIPQTPTQSCTIVLQYSVSGQPRTPVTLPIPSEPVWEAGRQYVYTVSVAADVTMTVDVVDWTVYDFNIEW